MAWPVLEVTLLLTLASMVLPSLPSLAHAFKIFGLNSEL
jgi:hypothetical protein